MGQEKEETTSPVENLNSEEETEEEVEDVDEGTHLKEIPTNEESFY